jgi:hypothetical protein
MKNVTTKVDKRAKKQEDQSIDKDNEEVKIK